MADEKKLTIAELRKAAIDRATEPIKELGRAISEDIQALRESGPAKFLDKAIETTDKILGPSGKAWLANGLDELRQAVALGNGQIQGGNNPGLFGTITTGEATAERMGELSMDDLRGYAAARAKEADHAMERGHNLEHEKGLER